MQSFTIAQLLQGFLNLINRYIYNPHLGLRGDEGISDLHDR